MGIAKTGDRVLSQKVYEMKKESREQLLQAYDEAFAKLGFESFVKGLRYISDEVEKNLRILRQARTREGLEAALARHPEPNSEQLAAMIKVIHLFPYQLRRVLPEAAKEAAKQLPQDPGERPNALKPEDLPKICDDIGKMISYGINLNSAQARVALQRGVSERTIQRVWQRRKDFNSKVLTSSDDS